MYIRLHYTYYIPPFQVFCTFFFSVFSSIPKKYKVFPFKNQTEPVYVGRRGAL